MGDALDFRLLVDVMNHPAKIEALSVVDLDRLVRFARRSNVLANLAQRVRAESHVPASLEDVFQGAEIYAAEQSRRIEWELQQLAPYIRDLGCPVLVLKGGAYLAMGLRSSRYRLVSDVDLLVAESEVSRVEAHMLAHGYRSKEEEEYDERYYREWMHEVPPMLHLARGTVVDLHHTISPPVSRLPVDADKLIERSVPLEQFEPFRRLCDEDLVLHLCIHMFHAGELDNSLRELFDLDAMLRRFAEDDSFWTRLPARSQEMAAIRPLYFGVHFCHRLLHTPIPDEVRRFLDIAAPLQPWRGVLEAMMQRSLLPEAGERPSLLRAFSVDMMLWRAHWLRMPTGMLIKHLWTQMRRRGGLKTREEAQEPYGNA